MTVDESMVEAEALSARIAAENIRLVDLRFTDLAGHWRQTSLDAARVDPALLWRGVMIDGSLVPGWRDIAESDLLLRPDLGSAFIDPFAAQTTLALFADATEPGTGVGYERDPRSCAVLAEQRLQDLCEADAAVCSLDLGFFLFDDVRIEQGPLRSGFVLESSESRTAWRPRLRRRQPRPSPGLRRRPLGHGPNRPLRRHPSRDRDDASRAGLR